MDPIPFRRRSSVSSSPKNPTDRSTAAIGSSFSMSVSKSGFGSSPMKLTKVLGCCLIALPLVVFLTLVLRNPHADQTKGFPEARVLERINQPNSTSSPSSSKEDKFISGLLSPGFDESSCLSRYQSSSYRKTSPYKPSPYLISRLRSYEQLHKQCGPGTRPYNEALKILKSGHSVTSISTECKYVVWMSFSGLGNRILTVASSFLYALLTNRVLLIDPGKDIPDLFCEPFPETSWLLPDNYPLKKHFDEFGQNFGHCYGNMLKRNIINTSVESPYSYLYLHLAHDYNEHDKLFFCDEDQAFLEKVPWLILKTNNYFVPSLFLMPSFEQELSQLFPRKDTVFHHLGRYLFHPSNHVWGLIIRYYQVYLAKADERIGMQIRIFEPGSDTFQHVIDQISACTLKENLLPEVDTERSIITTPTKNPKLKVILMTSLSPGYYENLQTIYWEHPTINGDLVGVYQPSHEMFQQSEKQLHNRKALAEMYLLSMSDVLVTSAWSTFGYVAQGLGGLRPWILIKAENQTVPVPPCQQVMSMEPCFHAPPFYDCKAKKGIDTGEVVPYVKHCEDMSWGLKVIDENDH